VLSKNDIQKLYAYFFEEGREFLDGGATERDNIALLFSQIRQLQAKCENQRRELRRLNKPTHWAHMAVNIYERVSKEIDESLRRMGIELPLKVKN
jgi:hypothetical protein